MGRKNHERVVRVGHVRLPPSDASVLHQLGVAAFKPASKYVQAKWWPTVDELASVSRLRSRGLIDPIRCGGFKLTGAGREIARRLL